MAIYWSKFFWKAGRKPNTEVHHPSDGEGELSMACSGSIHFAGMNALNPFPNVISIFFTPIEIS
jgi:hypothetical protein